MVKDVSIQNVIDFAAEVLRVDSARLSPETAHGAIPEWDSVMHLRLVMELAPRFGVVVALDEIPRLRTLADFHARLRAASAQKETAP